MKRIISMLFISFICTSFTYPCFAASFQNPPVTDGAEYLDSTQLNELSVKLDEIRQKYEFDVAIVTEKEMSGSDGMSSADDIYDYGGYGAGANDDGILLYICSSTRDYHITTHADGLRVFNKNGIKYLQKNIQPHLANDDYYLAMNTFATLADELLSMAESGKPFNEKQYSSTYMLVIIGCALLIPLLIAYIMMNGKLAKMKTAVENDYAADYVKAGSKKINISRDIFLYSNIVKTEKPKDDSESHESSSGRTHGGGGGKF